MIDSYYVTYSGQMGALTASLATAGLVVSPSCGGTEAEAETEDSEEEDSAEEEEERAHDNEEAEASDSDDTEDSEEDVIETD